MSDQPTEIQDAPPSADPTPDQGTAPEPRTRRSLLTAAAAALGAVAAQSVASVIPTEAATGSTVRAGLANTATGTTTVKATGPGVAALRGWASNTTQSVASVGVAGQSDAPKGAGVLGIGGGQAGVGVRAKGEATGVSGDGRVYGVSGFSATGTGVIGASNSPDNAAIVANAQGGGPAIVADAPGSGSTAIRATGGANGVKGVAQGNNGTGVRGEANQGAAAWGVGGLSSSGQGVHGESTAVANAGVYGTNTGATNGVGVAGRGQPSNGYGVQGFGNIGVYGEATSQNGAGVRGVASGSATVAGSFQGNVAVQGTLSKSAGSFVIDHPLDPENRYLAHSFVESPEMLNVYSGSVQLDANGRATVRLPRYFEALNMEPRVQLTPVGAPAPNLHLAREVSGNRFAIAGGAAGQKVFWQVTGVRQDAYARDHRIKVDTPKKAADRGRYLNPESFGRRRTEAIGHRTPPKPR